MSYEVTKYPQATFCWADIASTDMPKTTEFLKSLFDWNTQEFPTSEGRPNYTMFMKNDKFVAGGKPGFDPKLPSFWSNYISVDNVDEVAAKAESLGGKITMPAMDVMDTGRMAVIQDPTGAQVGLWQKITFPGAQLVNTVGAMCWNELYTKDVEKAKDFFEKLLGWTFETDDTGYTMIKNNGRANGGIFQITEAMPMPPCWMVYFTVANLTESVKKATDLGGKVWMAEKEIGVGKIATLSDPTGAGMVLIEMNVEPEHWKE